MTMIAEPVEAFFCLEDGGRFEYVFVSERGEQGLQGDPGVGVTEEDLGVAVAAEAAIRAAADDAFVIDLADEVDRATAAETGVAATVTTLSGALDVEVDRAVAAEDALDAAVTAETVRAAAAEGAESAARIAAEGAESAARIAADGAEAVARANADALLQATAQKNAANGYAGLDANGEYDAARIPATIARDAEVTAMLDAATAAIEDAYQAEIAAAIAALIAAAPGVLNTLDEIAAALGDDPDFAATITAALAGKQASHANLTAFAGLALAANKLPYATGAGALALADFTAKAREVLACATAGDMRTVLGLGTAALSDAAAFDVAGAAAAAQAASQPLDAELTSLAGLATAAYGRDVLTQASAAALRAYAELGTAATHAHGDYETAGAAATETTARLLADAQYEAINAFVADHTLDNGDLRDLIVVNKATAVSLLIPTDATLNFPIGTRFDWVTIGAGQVTVAAVTPGTTTVTSTGATVASPKSRMQHSGGSVVKTAANVWRVVGDVV